MKEFNKVDDDLRSPPASLGRPRQPQNVAKVIKGEIHNVLNVMRADARYASPQRFAQELSFDEHPLLLQLRELHEKLSLLELKQETPNLVLYITPFCSAISGRDISASITGAALSALQKFLLYGFITPETEGASEGMTLVAKSLLHCTFEESNSGATKNTRSTRAVSEVQDEEVVLKLLGLSALVVRYSLFKTRETPLLDASVFLGLLDTCLHVTHRARDASALLKSAAEDALGQIVLVTFGTRDVDGEHGVREEDVSVAISRSAMLSKLASLVNPINHSDATCVTALKLINIALETMRHQPSPAEISILQNDLCKYLLQWSNTSDLVILSLTLRVIFNLFQTIRDHLKVQLEVFLTSVHLRILDPSSSSSNEQREVVLESLVEFCAEPALMQDLYRNYDCDVHCSNLYEVICETLARVSEVVVEESPADAEEPGMPPPLNALNRLAIEGILAVIDSIARRCQGRGELPPSMSSLSSRASDVSDTESDTGSINPNEHISDLGDSWEVASSEDAQILLQQRKRRKYWLEQIAQEFNRRPMGKEWVQIAEQSNIVPSPADPSSIASLLFAAPHLDKTQLGLYLSKGPVSKYPFHADVRNAFASLFNFRGMSFSNALRFFLKKFRLPGEAQCIDRLMEAFAARLYEQQQLNAQKVHEEIATDDMLHADQSQNAMPFKSADAVFVLSFSTIMLNTDLHNPTIKDSRRMTVEQFIRNNRGINDGDDLPEQFLSDLYHQIKQDEIQVQTELSDVVQYHSTEEGEFNSVHWDGLLSKYNQVSKPFFTPAEAARRTNIQAGVHEKDMFLSMSQSSIQCIASVFARSHDDVLVVKTLKGFKHMLKICVYYDLDEMFNEILQVLLTHGRDYVIGCIVLNYAGLGDGTSQNGSQGEDSEHGSGNGDRTVGSESLVPKSLIESNVNETDEDIMHPKHPDLIGSADHRGLLALDCAFKVIRFQTPRIREAWPLLIECLCALRDAKSLPVGLADLDDFADSSGRILPRSRYARQAQDRLDQYYQSLAGLDNNQGWFTLPSFFKRGASFLSEEPPTDSSADQVREETPAGMRSWLLSVAEGADLKQVVLMRAKNLPLAKQTIRALLDTIEVQSCVEEGAYELHAVFAVELAARAFFANRSRANELFPLFLAKFEVVLGSQLRRGVSSKSSIYAAPFLAERLIVTILRSCIHLYDIVELRPQLKASLLFLIKLPTDYVRFVSDRIGCGMAILLRGAFSLFDTEEEWNFMLDMLATLAHFGPGRGFVFDGIASTVEYALPDCDNNPAEDITQDDYDDPSKRLSEKGCIVFCKLLVKFADGSFQKDLSLQVPAVLCLGKVYRRLILIRKSLDTSDKDEGGAAFDYDLWESTVKASYAVGLSNVEEASHQGCECLHGILLEAEHILPQEKWMSVLNLMVSRKPPVVSEGARVNTFSLIGKVLLIAIENCSHHKDCWDELSGLVNQTAVLIGENLREGRRGTVSPLFERTLQTVTYLCNHMVTNEFGGDEEFSQWASETLLLELEKVGASGGTFKNVAAISRPACDDQEMILVDVAPSTRTE